MQLEGDQIEIYQCLKFIEIRANMIKAMREDMVDPLMVVDQVKKSIEYKYPKAIGTALYYETAFFIQAYLKYYDDVKDIPGFHEYFHAILDVTSEYLKSRVGFQKNEELDRLTELLSGAGAHEFVKNHSEYSKAFSKRWSNL